VPASWHQTPFDQRTQSHQILLRVQARNAFELELEQGGRRDHPAGKHARLLGGPGKRDIGRVHQRRQIQFCRSYSGRSPDRSKLFSDGLVEPSAGFPVSATSQRQPALAASVARAASRADCAPWFRCSGMVAVAFSEPISPYTKRLAAGGSRAAVGGMHSGGVPLSGSRRESHPPAPTDPGVTISRHRALVILSTRIRAPMPSGPTVYLTASACPHNSSRKNTLPVDQTNTPQMTRPLGSTPTAPSRGFTATTSRSASTPRDGTHCLPVSAARQLPLAIHSTPGQQCRGVPSHVPCKSSRPGSRRLYAGHRLARNTDTRQTPPGLTYYTPVLMSLDWVSTRQQRSPKTRTAHRLPDPHLTHLVRLFHIAHHDGLQPTQHVVVCSHPPQGGCEGPHLHLLHSTVSKSSIYKQNSSPRSWHTSVPKSRVIWRSSELRRCKLSPDDVIEPLSQTRVIFQNPAEITPIVRRKFWANVQAPSRDYVT